MIGLPIELLADFLSDNESVYKHASFAKYQLKKKHRAIFFHLATEFMVDDIIIVHKVDTNGNLNDLLTK